MQEKITSLQNNRIKFFSSLQEKSRIRKKEKKFLVEGLREISLAIKGGFQLSEIYFCDDIISVEDLKKNNLLSLVSAKN